MTIPEVKVNAVSEWLNHHKFLLTLTAGVIGWSFSYFAPASEFRAYTISQAAIDAHQNNAISVLDWESKLSANRTEQDELIDSADVLNDKQRRKLDRLQRDEKRFEDNANAASSFVNVL